MERRRPPTWYGFFSAFFALQGDEFKDLDYELWKHERETHQGGFWLYIEGLRLNDLLEVTANVFIKYETTEPTVKKDILEIVAPPPAIVKEEDYLILLNNRLTKLSRIFRSIVEAGIW